MTGRRRSRMEIIADILAEALNGVNKTKIVYRANLNFVQLKNYLEILLDKGLIAVEKSKQEIYRTTEKGRDLLDAYRKMSGLI